MAPSLDSEAAATLRPFQDVPPWHSLTPAAARRLEADLFTTADPPPVDSVRDVAIPGRGGAVRLRLYQPEDTPAPFVVFIHGGGFVMGSPETVEGMCRRLCRRAGATVVAPEYRLAPEHPFPAAVDDCHTVVKWVAEYGADIGGDGTLVLAGSSAGGALATAVAMRVRGRDGPRIDRQVLLYPMTDADSGYESRSSPFSTAVLSDRDIEWFWEQYLSRPIDHQHPEAVPMQARDLSGVPPAIVLTAGVDVLRDEGRVYADRLAAAGVTVDHRHYPGMPHAFLSLAPTVGTADEALDALSADLSP